jgi:hypothetical protein
MILLQPKDFEPVLGPLTPYVAGRVERYGFQHRHPSRDESDRAVLDMIRAVYEDPLPVSGPARHPIWEDGWGQNLASFKPEQAGREAAKPRYFNKYPVVRWRGDLYVAESPDYEYNMLAVLQDWWFDKFLRRAKDVYEFGCGTGHNLFRVRDVNETVALHGADWAQSAVEFINLQAKHGATHNLSAFRFDFFNPDPAIKLEPQSAVYTVAALEQTGTRFGPFVDWLIGQGPSIVLHIEPIEEVLDPGVLLDFLSSKYFAKRNYLRGYLSHLRSLEQAGRIKIHEVVRTRVGSKFIEGYTAIAWSPTTGI